MYPDPEFECGVWLVSDSEAFDGAEKMQGHRSDLSSVVITC